MKTRFNVLETAHSCGCDCHSVTVLPASNVTPRSWMSQATRILLLAGAFVAGLRGESASPGIGPVGSPGVGGTATRVPTAPVVLSASDKEWNALLKESEAGRNASNTPLAKTPPLTAAKRAEQAAAFVAHANQFKDFRTKNPAHPATKQAQQKEVVSLAFAALTGDTTQDLRRQTLLDAVRRDSDIAPLQRYEAVAWSHQVAVARQQLRSRPALLAAHENTGRQLIVEFPALANGYESLLAVARDSAPARGETIARDVLLMTAAPPAIKTEAQLVLDRFALTGKTLGAVLAPANAKSLLGRTAGAPAIVYTWKAANKSSLQAARHLAKLAPRAVMIGVCLDADLTAARQTAAREKLPGVQFPETGNSAALLIGALKLNRASLVYLVDRAGVIRDVQGLDDTAEKLVRFGL